MARQKISQLRVSYDKDADVLYISKGNSQETIGEMLDNGIIIRRDLKNKKIIGIMIVDSAMKDNPTIARIRETRMKISARFGHDIEKLGRYYMERQKRHQHKLIKASSKISQMGLLADESALKKDWNLAKENKAWKKI